MNTRDSNLGSSTNNSHQPMSDEMGNAVGQTTVKSWLVPALSTALTLLLIVLCVFAYRNYQLMSDLQNLSRQLDEQSKSMEDDTSTGDTSKNVQNEVAQEEKNYESETDSWDIYQNSLAGFSIKHPNGWRIVESNGWVGFGPSEIGEDVVWGVSYYDKSSTTISEIKSNFGSQFSSRQQVEEEVVLNDQTATKLITTTDDLPSWYSVNIIVSRGNFYYVIGNGAQTDEDLNQVITNLTSKASDLSFYDFYQSFE